MIYLPESDFEIDTFLTDVREAFKVQNSVVVCVSEGISDKEGKFICEYGAEATVDGFGHKMLAGCGKVLEQIVRKEIGCKARSIELNLPQRCSAVLASATDISEAEAAGRFALRSALEGNTGMMAAFERVDGSDYQIAMKLVDVAKVCNQEKKFPQEWITNHGTDISEAFLDYAVPLIQGESKVPFENGLPSYPQSAFMLQ